MTHTDQDALADALQRLQQQLHEADAPSPIGFRADTRLVDGFQTTAQVRQFSFAVDEPPQLGGTDTGPNPVELVLVSRVPVRSGRRFIWSGPQASQCVCDRVMCPWI